MGRLLIYGRTERVKQQELNASQRMASRPKRFCKPQSTCAIKHAVFSPYLHIPPGREEKSSDVQVPLRFQESITAEKSKNDMGVFRTRGLQSVPATKV